MRKHGDNQTRLTTQPQPEKKHRNSIVALILLSIATNLRSNWVFVVKFITTFWVELLNLLCIVWGPEISKTWQLLGGVDKGQLRVQSMDWKYWIIMVFWWLGYGDVDIWETSCVWVGNRFDANLQLWGKSKSHFFFVVYFFFVCHQVRGLRLEGDSRARQGTGWCTGRAWGWLPSERLLIIFCCCHGFNVYVFEQTRFSNFNFQFWFPIQKLFIVSVGASVFSSFYTTAPILTTSTQQTCLPEKEPPKSKERRRVCIGD